MRNVSICISFACTLLIALWVCHRGGPLDTLLVLRPSGPTAHSTERDAPEIEPIPVTEAPQKRYDFSLSGVKLSSLLQEYLVAMKPADQRGNRWLARSQPLGERARNALQAFPEQGREIAVRTYSINAPGILPIAGFVDYVDPIALNNYEEGFAWALFAEAALVSKLDERILKKTFVLQSLDMDMPLCLDSVPAVLSELSKQGYSEVLLDLDSQNLEFVCSGTGERWLRYAKVRDSVDLALEDAQHRVKKNNPRLLGIPHRVRTVWYACLPSRKLDLIIDFLNREGAKINFNKHDYLVVHWSLSELGELTVKGIYGVPVHLACKQMKSGLTPDNWSEAI